MILVKLTEAEADALATVAWLYGDPDDTSACEVDTEALREANNALVSAIDA
jgi:hypothetical protein